MNNKIYRVKGDVDGPMGIQFRKGQDVQILRGMVYMGGLPVSQTYQETLMGWIKENEDLFIDIT